MAISVNNVFQERTDIANFKGVYVSLSELVAIQSQHCTFNLKSKRKAGNAMAGSHLSHFRGRGVDFDEVRIYQPGDDVRNIDWRVTARTGHTHTKIFREERERPIYIVVDQSRALFFGSQRAFKSVAAAETAAYLAWGSRTHNDRIGGFLFNDSDIQEIRPKEGKQGIQNFLRLLVEFNQKLSNGGNLTPSAEPLLKTLESVRRVVRPGSLVFVISDFRHMNASIQQQFSLIARHSDVVAINVSDPMEQKLPPPGNYGFTDGIQALNINTQSRELRKRYGLKYIEHNALLEDQLLGVGVPIIQLSTADNVADVLQLALGLQRGSRNSPRGRSQ